MKELSHSKSCIEQVNKYCVQYVSDNGLHPVTWLSCPSGNAITYFLTYNGLIHTFVPLKFCHLGWYRYFVWPMNYHGLPKTYCLGMNLPFIGYVCAMFLLYVILLMCGNSSELATKYFVFGAVVRFNCILSVFKRLCF